MKTFIILAAGQGTRLRPLTDSIPKCMVQINNKSLIEHLVKHFKDWSDRIILVSGYYSSKLEEYISRTDFNVPVEIVYNKDFATTNSLYSACLTSTYWGVSTEIIFSNSDVVFEKGALNSFLKDDSDIVLSVDKKNCDWEDMRVSINNDSGLITRVSKEIPISQSLGEFTGISKLNKNGLYTFKNVAFDLLKDSAMKKKGWYDLVFDKIAQEHKNINYVSLPDNSYYEIDTLEDLEDVKNSSIFENLIKKEQ